QIDDVRIYNRVLTSGELQTLTTGGGSPTPPAPPPPPGPPPPPTPPPAPRTNDHDEGFLDGGKCGCGAAPPGIPAPAGIALLAALGLLALALRR
ncbi:MAG: MYXO-CTERM sorting domain-containing protein, partial [Actinomycetota bacterium]